METQLKMLCDRDDWSGAIKFASKNPVALSEIAQMILEKCQMGSARDSLLRSLISILARMGLFEKAGRLILLIYDSKMRENQETGLRATILEAIDETQAV